MFASPNNAAPFSSTPLEMKSSIQTRPLRVVAVSCKSAAAAADNYYKLLSVSGGSDASSEEIKRAYRAMALQYHPDVCDPSMKEQSTRMFVQLNAAYKTLSDPVLKREYDDSVMGLEDFHRGRSFEGDKTVWQRQILELRRRRSALWRDPSSWGARMRAQNCYGYE